MGSFSSIFKTILLGFLIYGLFIVCMVFFFSSTIGIVIQVSGLFFLGMVVVFALVGYQYTRQPAIPIQGRKITKKPMILIIVAVLITAQIVMGAILIQPNTHVTVGVTWWYDQEKTEDIHSVLQQMQQIGFSALRLPYFGDRIEYPTYNSSGNYLYQETDLLYASLATYKMDALLICPTYATPDFVKYIEHWGEKIAYFQLANELDILYWQTRAGSTTYPYTREELEAIVQNLKQTIMEALPPGQTFKTITTFSAVFPARVDLLLPGTGRNGFEQIGRHVDYVGYDYYLEEGGIIRPIEVNYLRSLTQRHIWITEVGACTFDDQKQANYIVSALDFARRNDVERVYVAYWMKNAVPGTDDSVGKFYGINGRLAEQAIQKWIRLRMEEVSKICR